MQAEANRKLLWPPMNLAADVRNILLHSLAMGLALSVADLLFNFYLVSLGYGTEIAGTMSTVVRLAGVIFGLPLGLLIDRSGPRRALLLGIAAYALGYLFLLSVSSLWMLVIAQLMIGAAYTLTSTAVSPLMFSVAHAEQRAQLLGLNASAILIVGLLGGLVGGSLPALAAGLVDVAPQSAMAYRLALSVVVGLALLSALPVFGIRGGTSETLVAGGASARLVAWPVLLRYSVGALLLGIGGGALLPFQNLFFRERFGLVDGQVGLLFAAMSVGMGLGAVLGGQLARRIGVQRACWTTRLLAAPAVMIMALAPDVLPSAIGFILRGLLIAASFPLYDSLVMSAVPPQQRGMAASVISLIWSLGWAITAATAGWAELVVGFTPVLLAASLAYVFSAWSIMTLRLPDASAGER